jgi:hypothetical protein
LPVRVALRICAVLLTGAVVFSCSPQHTRDRQPITTPSMTIEPEMLSAIDHVILAIDSLDRGIALLRKATGVTPVYGGAHPGQGTQNAILSLGRGTYLELLAPNPQDSSGPAQVAEFARYRALTPVGWAVRTANADSLRTALVSRALPGGVVHPGSRRRRDGAMLSWKTVDPWGPVSEVLLPFFIQWDPSGAHPSSDAPTGCTLEALTFASPIADSVRVLLSKAALRVPVVQAPREAMSVTLDCLTGPVAFPAPVP